MVTPLSYEQIQLLYKANDIKFDRCNLYYDFIKSLNVTLFTTYLGEEYIKTESEIKEHFVWCLDKVIKDFNQEKIEFGDTGKIKDYFFYFYYELFYINNEKSLEKLNKLADLSFDFNRIKSRSDMDILIELYKMFEKSLYYKTKK
jgi:hypothetical protein